ncbi:MAG: DUF3969 family protein [Pseudomonas sp.]|uniref:DUF3969 family protein n=1 Tax=unclassified Pseudomonas TaxID=196821 RepID=UPI001CFAE3E6|nr:DUF3969 family protein [Pseudomonas sp. L5B5]UCZ84735.1 DUF3969 family protein [Pseudomonas sp. L5B5]
MPRLLRVLENPALQVRLERYPVKDVSLLVQALGRDEATRLICTLAIGSLCALRAGAIALEEAERMVFTPGTASILRAKGLPDELSELVLQGCELEDVQSLIPERLDAHVQRLIECFTAVLRADAGYAQRADERVGRERLFVIA